MQKAQLANDQPDPNIDTMNYENASRERSIKKDILVIIWFTLIYLLVGFFIWKYGVGTFSLANFSNSLTQSYWTNLKPFLIVYFLMALSFQLTNLFRINALTDIGPSYAIILNAKGNSFGTYRKYLSRFNNGIVQFFAPIIAFICATLVTMLALRFT